mmetsp:Transcript_7661/g.18147  ORF Transcript_7661/g.18147 Transcript_7661/m.18147 type:complete len:115 (-) Transcript_7661:611-955(-)
MRIGARVVLTATAILFLPAAAKIACPAGWTPSPANATCFLVPPERSTSLFRCVDLVFQCERRILVQAAREEVARDAVEVIEVAKASLDHGEQMLAIARQKAPRLASIEGCELLR